MVITMTPTMVITLMEHALANIALTIVLITVATLLISPIHIVPPPPIRTLTLTLTSMSIRL